MEKTHSDPGLFKILTRFLTHQLFIFDRHVFFKSSVKKYLKNGERPRCRYVNLALLPKSYESVRICPNTCRNKTALAWIMKKSQKFVSPPKNVVNIRLIGTPLNLTDHSVMKRVLLHGKKIYVVLNTYYVVVPTPNQSPPHKCCVQNLVYPIQSMPKWIRQWKKIRFRTKLDKTVCFT